MSSVALVNIVPYLGGVPLKSHEVSIVLLRTMETTAAAHSQTSIRDSKKAETVNCDSLIYPQMTRM